MRRLLPGGLALTILIALAPAFAQETEGYGPRPILWAVPHLQLWAEEGGVHPLRGVDASLALPLTPRTNVTATYFWDWANSSDLSATFNYDHPLADDTTLRGSIGLIQDEFGFGVTWHRSLPDYGLGAYAQSVDGDFVGGVMVTRPISWGFTLGRLPGPRRDESRDWSSGGGDVADLGARAAATLSLGGNRGELATTTAYFPLHRTAWVREGRTAQSGSATGLAFTPPLAVAWTHATGDAIRTSAAIVGDRVYVGSRDGWLYALDLSTGRRLWRFPVGGPVTGAPAAAGGRVYCATGGGTVLCVADGAAGGLPAPRLVWSHDLGSPVSGSPLVCDSGMVLIGAGDGYVYGLERTSGKQVWRLLTGGPVVASPSKIARRIPAAVDAEGLPTTHGATAVIASSDGKLYAVEEVRGRVVWTFASEAPITGAPVVYDNRVYAANRAGTLCAVEADSGREIWRTRLEGVLRDAPAADERNLYVTSRDGDLWAVQRDTGLMVWRGQLPAPSVSAPVIVRDDILYLPGRDGRLAAMDARNGLELWQMAQPEAWTSGPAIAGGLMVVGGENGTVTALRAGAGPAPQRLAAAGSVKAPDAKVQPAATPPATVAPEAPAAVTPAPAAVATVPAATAPAVPATVEPTPVVTTPVATSPAKLAPVATLPAGTQAAKGEDFPAPLVPVTPVTPAAPAAEGVVMTLMITPADGSIPTMLSNQRTIYVGGKIAPGSGITQVRINQIEARIRNGEYGTNITFPGPGAYEVVVTAENVDGKSTNHRRHVQVLDSIQAVANQAMALSQRGGSFIATFSPGVRNAPAGRPRKTIELQNARGQLVRSWSMMADVAESVNWNGTDSAGVRLPAGRYQVTYVLVDDAGATLASVAQPIDLSD